ncbi:MAG: ankyrin repeat domain-containing protein, partial [Bryobacteraceae bacterium]|nr:ankyrin repeat domain-containing protein [Bryobacteraceae bacterium]
MPSLLSLAPLFLIALAAAASDLHHAARAGDLEKVKALLREGAPVNARDSLGGTALHDAAWAGEREVVEALLDAGADVNAEHTEAGSTPLHYAVITNHLEIVKLLLS